MKQFVGFPSGRMDFTPVPNAFFSTVLNNITDIAELKTTLHVLAMLYRKKGYPRFVSFGELLENVPLMQDLGSSGELLHDSLKKAVATGTLLSLAVEKDGASEDIFFLNDEPGRQAVARIGAGELKLPGLKASPPVPVPAEALPDIFTLYEQNIGMLTPLIADELRDAEKLYPPDWIRDAIKEAVLHNKRNIKYINKILETWSVEGRSDGTYPRDSKEAGPDKYFKGRYGHMVRR
jgi:DnaD/phage-associated family protein